MSVSASVVHDHGYDHEFIHRGKTFFTTEICSAPRRRLVKIDKPDDAEAGTFATSCSSSCAPTGRSADKTYPAGALLAADFDGFLKGKRKFDVLFEPTERKSLAAITETKNYIVLNELDNVRNRLYALNRENGKWTRKPLRRAREFGTASVDGIDSA